MVNCIFRRFKIYTQRNDNIKNRKRTKVQRVLRCPEFFEKGEMVRMENSEIFLKMYLIIIL